MKIKDIREKNQKELKRNLSEIRNKLTKMKFDISGKQMKNHREIRKIKKDIAMILTHLREGSGGQAVQ
ncbi:MAG: 50S ribosomal protein L29 [Candidatus Moranbacteria bacterium]|nr:50S ribosomal protein L29 [Candidatus Moranbacteria bacterium]